MCLLVLAWQAHSRYRLILAANRDEFHERPSSPLARWADRPSILGGRDLRAGGTWLALDEERRLGIVTNYRDLQSSPPGAPSRGELIPSYLLQAHGAVASTTRLAPGVDAYAGFNLLLFDERELSYLTNRATPRARALPPGIYALSNHLLDTPWPKVTRVRRGFESWLARTDLEAGAPDTAALFALLADRTPAADQAELPHSGLSAEWERVLSSPFVLNPSYGTRSSTVVLLERHGGASIRERRFDPGGELTGETVIVLAPGEWPRMD